MKHALLRPDNTIDRVEANIDPTVDTRQGWRWLPYAEDSFPTMNDPLASAAERLVVSASEVRKVYDIVMREPGTKDVDAERDRRMSVFTFGGTEFDFDESSRVDIAGAGILAFAAIINGAQPGDLRWSDPDEDFTWIARDNSRVPMDAQTCFAFGQAAAKWRSDLIFRARNLKDAEAIPSDYADDAHWS